MISSKNYFYSTSSPPPPTLLQSIWANVQNFCKDERETILVTVCLMQMVYLGFPYVKRIWTFIVEKARKTPHHMNIKDPQVIGDEVQICMNIFLNGPEVLERRVRVYRSENGVFKRLSPEEEQLIQDFLLPKLPLVPEIPQVDQIQIEEPQGVEVFEEPVGQEVGQIEIVEVDQDIECDFVGEVEDFEYGQDVEVESEIDMMENFEFRDTDDEFEDFDEMEARVALEELAQENEYDLGPVHDAENVEEPESEDGFYQEIAMMENSEFRDSDDDFEDLYEVEALGLPVEHNEEFVQENEYDFDLVSDAEESGSEAESYTESEIDMMLENFEFRYSDDEFGGLLEMEAQGFEVEHNEELVQENGHDFGTASVAENNIEELIVAAEGEYLENVLLGLIEIDQESDHDFGPASVVENNVEEPAAAIGEYYEDVLGDFEFDQENEIDMMENFEDDYVDLLYHNMTNRNEMEFLGPQVENFEEFFPEN